MRGVHVLYMLCARGIQPKAAPGYLTHFIYPALCYMASCDWDSGRRRVSCRFASELVRFHGYIKMPAVYNVRSLLKLQWL
jgi:hypothetical protein